MLNNENSTVDSSNSGVHAVERRKSYSKPHLEELGDLRTTTLGVSPGLDESDSTGMHRRELGLDYP